MKLNISKQNIRKNLIIIPILLIIFILPLIVRMKMLELGPDLQPYWNGDKLVGDVFTFYKMVFLLFCSSVLFVGMMMNLSYVKKTKGNRYILLIAIYGVLAVLSTIFSQHRNIAIIGFADRFEGMLTVLAYVLLAISCIIFIENDEEVKALYKGLTFSAAAIGLIGVLQFMGYDIFRTDLLQSIITPANYRDTAKMIFGFKPHAVYSTLQNPNYLGSYMSMLLPVSIVFFTMASSKRSMILYGLLSGIVFLTLLGSLSRAGLAGALVSAGLLLVLFRRQTKEKRLRLMSLLVSFAIVFAIAGYTVGFNLQEGSTQLLTNKREDKVSESVLIKNIELTHDTIMVKSDKAELNISFEENRLVFLDDNNNELKVKQTGDVVTFENEQYAQFKIMIPSKGGIIRVGIENREISFAYTGQAGFQVLKGNGTLGYIDYPESIGFENNQGFASSRGYIWSRTIPMIKEAIFVGYGPDTFVANFPQNDFIGKLNVFRTTDVIIDKPHNMYLQTASNTGLISLIAMLMLFTSYIWNSLKLYRNCSFESQPEIYGAASFLAVTAYLVAGLANDSVISVAPVFWILLGLGIKINQKLA